MKVPRRQFLHMAAGAAAVALLTISSTNQSAWSQANRQIKIVVPFPPGGGADILARLVADHIGRSHGAAVIIENRPGAGTMIATEAASRAAPDGGTVLIVANSFLINGSLRKLNYHPLTSFEPVCLLTRSPNVIAVNSTSPYRSLPDLLADARANPGKLTIAFQGPATGQHIATEKLKRAANIDMINVPFLGGSLAVNALLGNHVATLFVNYPSVAEQAKAGQVRILATASPSRIRSLPDIPTIAETTGTDFEEDVWFGVVVPAKTPQLIIAQLTDWFREAISDAVVTQKLAIQGFDAADTC